MPGLPFSRVPIVCKIFFIACNILKGIDVPAKSNQLLNKHCMKHLSLLLATCIVLSAPLLAQKIKTINGEGPSVTQDRNGGTFDEIHSKGSFDINITDGPTHSVKVEAQENIQQYIVVENKGNELHISNKKGYNLKTDKAITIHITAPALQAIHSAGSGNIKSENMLTGSDKFQIKSAGSGNIIVDIETSSLNTSIAGSGNITLKGKTKDMDASIAGSGNIKARDLQSAVTSISIAGSGNAEVVATEKLSTRIAGSGDVKYWGNASVDSKVMGSGSLKKEN